MPERAAYWTARKTLIVADLHWGKSEALQRAGVPLPSQALGEDLARLARALARSGAQRVLALGDLVHAASGVTGAVAAEVAAWRAALGAITFDLIRGNHDRRIALPANWNLVERPDGLAEGPFAFHHDASSAAADGAGVRWSGHIHPSVVLRSRYDRVRLPCFVVGERSVLMPAFGSMTGGADVRARAGERLYAVAGDRVITP